MNASLGIFWMQHLNVTFQRISRNILNATLECNIWTYLSPNDFEGQMFYHLLSPAYTCGMSYYHKTAHWDFVWIFSFQGRTSTFKCWWTIWRKFIFFAADSLIKIYFYISNELCFSICQYCQFMTNIKIKTKVHTESEVSE